MAANSSAKSGTMTSLPIQKSANLLEVSGISLCDVSAILSAGEMDDTFKKHLKSYLFQLSFSSL